MENIDKATSIIYYLYYHKKMHPGSIAGSRKIEDVFANAVELLLNITVEQFEQIEQRMKD
jgi:hypothetical protein